VGSALAGTWLGTITLLLLLEPLVIVPLGLEVIGNSAGSDAPPDSESLARKLQPAGAILAAVSFAFSPGVTAAFIATGWLLVCGLLTLSGVLRMLRPGYRSLEQVCFATGLVYITVGGIALVLSRLGARPMQFPEPIILLTAVHFHYAGFVLPIVAGAIGGALQAHSTWPKNAFRPIAYGSLISPAVLATGWMLASPGVKVLAALSLAVSAIALACLTLMILPHIQPRLSQMLLLVSALSLLAGMVLAGAYALSEFIGSHWLPIPQMAQLHGTVNALGFSLCGMLGWYLSRCESS